MEFTEQKGIGSDKHSAIYSELSLHLTHLLITYGLIQNSSMK